MGIVGKILGCIYIILGCLALLSAALGGELTEQQKTGQPVCAGRAGGTVPV